MSQNWRTETNAEDYFGHKQKQLNIADRRPVIRRASDLVGPGIDINAIRITDFRDVLATFNGFYSYEFVDAGTSTTADAPNTTGSFVGFVSSDAELGGVQFFFDLTTGTEYRRVFVRNPADPIDTNLFTWGSWAGV